MNKVVAVHQRGLLVLEKIRTSHRISLLISGVLSQNRGLN